MHEQVISFKTAKLAKEKEFNYSVKLFYNKSKNVDYVSMDTTGSHLKKNGELIVNYFDGCYNWNITKNNDVFNMVDGFNSSDGHYYYPICSCPSQSLIRKWLRENFNIDIEIRISYSSTRYFGLIFKNKLPTMIEIKKDFKTYEEALEKMLFVALSIINNKK